MSWENKSKLFLSEVPKEIFRLTLCLQPFEIRLNVLRKIFVNQTRLALDFTLLCWFFNLHWNAGSCMSKQVQFGYTTDVCLCGDRLHTQASWSWNVASYLRREEKRFSHENKNFTVGWEAEGKRLIALSEVQGEEKSPGMTEERYLCCSFCFKVFYSLCAGARKRRAEGISCYRVYGLFRVFLLFMRRIFALYEIYFYDHVKQVSTLPFRLLALVFVFTSLISLKAQKEFYRVCEAERDQRDSRRF